MDFWDLTKLLIRRWYLTLPLLLLSCAAVLVTAASVKPDYSATGHVQLIPPAVTPDTVDKAGRARNPWADLGPDALGEAVMITISKKAVLERLDAAGHTDNFTVTMEGRSPIIAIEAVGRTPRQASGTVAEIARLIDQDVMAQQRVYGVPRNESITTLTLDDGGNVETVRSKLKRALIVVAGLGVLLTAAVVVAVDALLRRRAPRRRPVPAASPALTPRLRLPAPRANDGAELLSTPKDNG